MTDTIATAFIAEAMSKGFDKLEQDFLKLSETEQRAVIDMMEAQAQATAKIQSEMERRVSIITQKEAEIRKQYDYTAQSSLKLGAAFGGVAAAGIAFLGSATQLAARVETLGVVTTRIGANLGMTEKQVRALEKSIQALGITTQGSRQAIAMMGQSNLDLSKATDLARLAQNAAVVTGENSTETFNKLVYAISSGSTEMLRTMMLSADFQSAYEANAKAVGKTANELTETEKVTIRMNEVLARGAGIADVYSNAMETSGKQAASLARHIEEARLGIGETFLPVYSDMIELVTDSLKTWNELDGEIKTGISTAGGYAVAIAAVESAVFLSIGTIMKMTAALKSANGAMTILGLGAGTTAALIALPVAAMVKAALDVYQANKALEANRNTLQGVREAAIAAGQSYEEFAKAAREAAEAAGLVEVEGTFREALPGRSFGGRKSGIQAEGVLPEIPSAEEYNLEASGVAQEKTEAIFRQSNAARIAAEKLHTADLNAEYAARTNRLRASAADQARWSAMGADAVEAAVQRELAALTTQAGLAAGIQGQLQKATEQYTKSIEDLRWQEGEMVKDLGVLQDGYGDVAYAEQEVLEDLDKATKKYGENSEQVADLNHKLADVREGYGENAEKIADMTHKLDENREAQLAAAEAMAEATAQMIFQQAAAGLDAGAALELARAMGVLSEQDYAVATSIQNLRNQFDANGDGMITAAEGAEAYAARVAEVNSVVGALQASGLDVTAENIAAGMQAIEESGVKMTPEWMEQIVAGEVDTVTKLGNVEKGVSSIATTAETTAATTATHMGGIQESAGVAEAAFITAKSSVDLFKSSIDLLPTEKTITITVNYVSTGEKPEFQHGGSFIVPPGFNHDNFPIFVSSGEKVIVQTRGQQHSSGSPSTGTLQISPGGSGVDIYNFNNYSRSAVSHSMALVRAAKAKRLNQSMGSPV